MKFGLTGSYIRLEYELFENYKIFFFEFLTCLYQLPPVLFGDKELINNTKALAKL